MAGISPISIENIRYIYIYTSSIRVPFSIAKSVICFVCCFLFVLLQASKKQIPRIVVAESDQRVAGESWPLGLLRSTDGPQTVELTVIHHDDTVDGRNQAITS